ncbi:MAG: tRNA (adenosine(37)-N6)-threonylcarbamoyltransferase complex dimerization subunit type 1 TsaB [Chloroflexota bacterium]
MLIAIDTSTANASLALVKDGELVAELNWRSSLNHSVELLPNLNYLLRQSGRDIASAQAIIVARGPGSYNGLRVGLSTAKGLAFSLGISLVGVSTLSVIAYAFAATGLPVCPMINAGRGEIATACYQMAGGRWAALEDERISTVSAVCAGTATRTVFCGELEPEMIREIAGRLADLAVLPSPAARLRRAAYLAELGQVRLSAGDVDPVAALEPHYLRRPPITRRNAGRERNREWKSCPGCRWTPKKARPCALAAGRIIPSA